MSVSPSARNSLSPGGMERSTSPTTRAKRKNWLWSKRWVIVLVASIISLFLVSLVLHTARATVTLHHLRRIQEEGLQTVYFVTVVTPDTQLRELLELGDTLSHAANVHWVVVEDGRSDVTEALIRQSGVQYYSLLHVVNTATNGDAESKSRQNSGEQNVALTHIERLTALHNNTHGVVYFGSEQHNYDIRFFSYLGNVQRIGVWPVGDTKRGVIGQCEVDETTGIVVGWNVNGTLQQTYPGDSAGFAVHTRYLSEMTPRAQPATERGLLGAEYISSRLVAPSKDIEAFDNCSRIYVWKS